MKKTVLFFSLLIPFIASAQIKGHLPLAIGDTWYFNTPPVPLIQVLADTQIAGKGYKVVYNGAVHSGYYDTLFLRVDSNKVFQYNRSTADEFLTYDFSASSGDTLSSDTTGFFRVCDQSQSVQFVGRTMRQWDFAYGSNCADCVNGETLVDSIGWTECWGAKYTNRLSKVILSGNTIVTAVQKIPIGVPGHFELSVFPNPFNPSATVQYVVPRSGQLHIALYNFLGQQVRDIFNGHSNSGQFSITLQGDDLSSGVYYCRAMFEGAASVTKVILLK